ncbi:MAG TPA: fibronectin type III domain-containing protein [Nitrospirota bacterium]
MHTRENTIARYVLIAAALMMLVTTASCGRKSALIPPGTLIPAGVDDLLAEMRDGKVILAWTMPGRNTGGSRLEDLGGFAVMRAEGTGEETDCMCEFAPVGNIDLATTGGAVVSGNRVAWTDNDPALAPGMTYAYKVEPYNKDGYHGPASNEVRLKLSTPPAVPSGLTATPGNGSVTLSWDKADKDSTGAAISDLAGYNVYRPATRGGPLGLSINRAPVTENSYTDTGLANNTAYSYRVSALRGQEPPYSEGMPSAEASAVPADIVPPAAPEGLRAVPAYGAVLLSWLPSPEADVAGYRLYRKGPGDEKPSPLEVGLNATITYRDTDVRPGAGYTYAVTAVDNATPPNESAPSLPATVAIPEDAGGSATSP